MALFRTKWNSVGLSENPLPLILFFKWKTYMFEKYERVILRPSSPDSVAIFKKKVGKTFYWVFLLSQPKKWIFDQNKINLGEKTEVTLVWENILKLLLYTYSNKLYIRYSPVFYLKQSLIAEFSASWTVS